MEKTLLGLLAILGSLSPLVIHRWIRLTQPTASPAEGTVFAGRVRMSRWLIYPSLIVSGALALFFSLLVGTSDAGNLWDHIALFSSLVTVPLIVFASCLHPLLKGWDVIWDGEGVTGPTKTYTFRPGRTQATLSWSDVKTYGRANNRKGFLIEGHNGVVIHWSELYAGSALPIEAVRLYARHRRSAHRH